MRDCAWSVCTELGSVTFKKVGVARECAKEHFFAERCTARAGLRQCFTVLNMLELTVKSLGSLKKSLKNFGRALNSFETV